MNENDKNEMKWNEWNEKNWLDHSSPLDLSHQTVAVSDLLLDPHCWWSGRAHPDTMRRGLSWCPTQDFPFLSQPWLQLHPVPHRRSLSTATAVRSLYYTAHLVISSSTFGPSYQHCIRPDPEGGAHPGQAPKICYSHGVKTAESNMLPVLPNMFPVKEDE